MRIDIPKVEETAKELYVRALKILPDDVKRGFDALAARETVASAREVLGTMITNIAVAERTDNLLCQDTGIPIYNVTIGRGVELGAQDGPADREGEGGDAGRPRPASGCQSDWVEVAGGLCKQTARRENILYPRP